MVHSNNSSLTTSRRELEKMFKRAFRAFLTFEWLLQYIRRPLTPEKVRHLQILLEQLRGSRDSYTRMVAKLTNLADRLEAAGISVDRDDITRHWKILARTQRNISQVEEILRRQEIIS